MQSEDGEIRAAILLLPTRNTVKRLINLLYPLETAPVSDELNSDPEPPEKIQQKENGVNVKTSVRKIKASSSKNCQT